jgi:membrane protein
VPDDANFREDPTPTVELGPEQPPAEEPAEQPQESSPGLAETAWNVASDALAKAEAARSSAVQAGVKQLRRRRKPFWVLIGRTLSKAWGDRILGLSAEAGFWQLLSLPPLLLAIFGTLGYVGEAFGHNVGSSIENSLVQAAQHFLTASTITDSLQPTIEDVLRNGRPDVISIGFVLSIWSGSTAMSTYVNTITIAYGERELRGAIRSRLLALRLYLAQVITGVVLLPALVLGPTIINRLLNQRGADLWLRRLVTFTYWPLVGLLSLTILTSLYHLSVPNRRPWRKAVPGAVLAMGIWLVGCYGLRVYVSRVFDRAVVYGTLAAPVAVLLFFYITAFAVLLGAEFNATLDLARREREAPPRVS